MAATAYGNERLGRLLRLLRPAPAEWVARAKQVFSEESAPGRPAGSLTPLTDGDVARLRTALDTDAVFKARFDADPVAAAEEAGMHDLALRLEDELRELVALAARVANDSAFRSELDADPTAALTSAGMPAGTAEPLLRSLAVSDDVLAKLPEVVAHRQEQSPLRAQLLGLLLGSPAALQRIRTASSG